MLHPQASCPDCGEGRPAVHRRDFLKSASVAGAAVAASAATTPLWALAKEPAAKKPSPESLVKTLYDGLSDEQRKTICHDWDHTDARGVLRTHVSNNWHINKHAINDKFYNDDQRQIIRAIFEGIIQPDWHSKIDKQLEDDAGGFGESQNVAIFGKPGDDKWELVMTGRHMTLRCDGNTTDHVAFGGPIFYGHAPDFNETPNHPGNVFWEQALAANNVYQMLDGKQRKLALVPKAPHEADIAFEGKDGKLTGMPVSEMTKDQQAEIQKVLQKLIEPYRQTDRDEVVACLKAQGGLEKCHLSFYADKDLGNDQVWDVWRLEGPAFCWHYRGNPHVHVFVNVADDPSVKTNAKG